MSVTSLLVGVYKQYYNPVLGGRCKYTPSCSSYMVQAVKKRGFLCGFVLGIWRILRCNPFSKGGFDPVKDNLRGRAKWLL